MTAHAHVHLLDGGTAVNRRDPPRPENTPFFAVLDQRGASATAETRWAQAEIRRIARAAAQRWACDVEDAEQEVRLLAWKKHDEGLPLKLVLRYTERDVLKARSPLRGDPLRSLTVGEDLPQRQEWSSPLTDRQVRALATLSASATAGVLRRIEDSAPLRCPACRGRGSWGSRYDKPPEGKNSGRCIENEKEARERWPLYDAPRKDRNDQVWWCSRCGGWTWDPAAVAIETHTEDELTVGYHGHGRHIPADPERDLIRFTNAGLPAGGGWVRSDDDEPEADDE